MRGRCTGLFLLAFGTLVVEVLLTRVFDVLLWPNLSFLVISCALFGLSVGGLFDLLWGSRREDGRSQSAAWIPAALFGVSAWMLPLLLNAIPFGFTRIAVQPFTQLAWFMLLYLVLLAPFFFAGLSVCRLFSRHAHDIHHLYFWDLFGAALGSAILIPLLPRIGPERLFALAGFAGLAASALLGAAGRSRAWLAAIAVAFVAVPIGVGHRYFVLEMHDNKREVQSAIQEGRLEYVEWDPVSQIAVVDEPQAGRKHVAYDGGTQSTNLFPFDGDFGALRRDLSRQLKHHFWQRGVLASHYLRRDTGHTALVIGSAGGQETKAALLYGASHVDAIEMVSAVVKLTSGRYADYIGRIFENPAVTLQVGEGRSFLRSSTKTYDVIQIFSNYTSSSVAEGSGALMPVYLQTAEAYAEYFSHLNPDGVLQVNRYVYPRMIATAAAAWRSLGRDDFRSHVVVFSKPAPEPDHLPTVLIKLSPWTRAEVDDLAAFFSAPMDGEPVYELVENPFNRRASFLPDVFYEGDLPADLVKDAPFNVSAVTDDRPYFNLLQRSGHPVQESRPLGLDRSTAFFINSRIRAGWIPMDWLHLVLALTASVFYGIAFVVLPLAFTTVGREKWSGKTPALTYFALLGFGFITLELVFIQIFIKLIGYPLYAVATVLTVMLIGAALGSATTVRLSGATGARWHRPFIGVVTSGLAIWIAYPTVEGWFISQPIAVRMVAAAVLILPIAFFMGMPFPLGLRALRQKPAGAIAWAWSMNGLFTTTSGVAMALLSFAVGFRATMLVAIGAYGAAGYLFAIVRRSNLVDVRNADIALQGRPSTAIP